MSAVGGAAALLGARRHAGLPLSRALFRALSNPMQDKGEIDKARDKDTLVASGLPGPPRSAKAGSTGNRLSSSTMCNRRSVRDEVWGTKCVPRALPTLCRTLRPTLRRLRFVHSLSRLHLGNQPATLCIGGLSVNVPSVRYSEYVEMFCLQMRHATSYYSLK